MSHSGFIFLGERAALDFVNTVRHRKDPLIAKEDILAMQGLYQWFQEAQQSAQWAYSLPQWSPGLIQKDLDTLHKECVELRHAIYELLNCVAPPSAEPHPHLSTTMLEKKAESLTVLNTYAQRLPIFELSLSPHDKDLYIHPNLDGEQLLGFIASDTIRLLGTPSLHKIKECAHPRCGILFEDRSRGMKRQWCSMKECGNRAKAARFAQR